MSVVKSGPPLPIIVLLPVQNSDKPGQLPPRRPDAHQPGDEAGQARLSQSDYPKVVICAYLVLEAFDRKSTL